ncbi:GcrA family cell cycle regulator [Rhizobium wenxiniae]
MNKPAKGEEHLFCGSPSERGKPYCTAKCRLAYRPAPDLALRSVA